MAKAFNLKKMSQYKEPHIKKCDCGNIVALRDSFSNECTECGKSYNSAGQLLAPKSQWGGETGSIFSSSKALTKTAQGVMPPMDPMGLNDSPELQEPINPSEYQEQPVSQNGMPKFMDGSQLKLWLDEQDPTSARTQLMDVADINEQQNLTEYLNQYYQTGVDENMKVELAASMFEMLVPEAKQADPNDESVVAAPYVRAFVEESNAMIKKLAEDTVANKKKAAVKPYNLSKIAQHKGFDNVIMFGPNQMHMDAFYRQPVSNMALLERNKGFGLVVDDVWDIDYEALWRTHIMDKFSRPYRDKDGNWVGGYIQKRFEVDKNIPAANNMQLKPGQKRRPILPEYGLTESRLEVQRNKEAKKEASTQPFNLKKRAAEFTKPFDNIEQKKKITEDELEKALRLDIAAELEAVNLYESHASASPNKDITEILESLADEEKVHVGELQKALELVGTDDKEKAEEGAKEVEKENKVAQVKELKPLGDPNIGHNEYLDGPKPENETVCQNCGAQGPNVGSGKALGICPSCGGQLKVLDGVQRRVDQPGKQYNPFSTNTPMMIQPGQQIAAYNLSKIKKADILGNFNKIKIEPDEKEEGELDNRVNPNFVSDDFKMCPKAPQGLPTQYVDDSIDEVTKSCEDLAIDG